MLSRIVIIIRRPRGAVANSVLMVGTHHDGIFFINLEHTIFRRSREHSSGLTQGQIGLSACPENPASVWRAVRPSLRRRCCFHAQYYRQIFRDVHPGCPEPSENGFVTCHCVRYGLDEEYDHPVICEHVNEQRRGDDVGILDSSWEV
jgi:hypothetical protein